MVTFASFPTSRTDGVYGYDRPRHPDSVDDEDEYMHDDFQDEDFASGSKLTCPGEALTSSHAFMRYAQKVCVHMSITNLMLL